MNRPEAERCFVDMHFPPKATISDVWIKYLSNDIQKTKFCFFVVKLASDVINRDPDKVISRLAADVER
ncbi:hypothetical protein D3C73_1582640 [compost metagenome]